MVMMNEERRRLSSLRIDNENVLRPFIQEGKYLQTLCQSDSIEIILVRLFDLLKPDDYRILFSTQTRPNFTQKWLETFSKFCMERYLESDEIVFHEFHSSTRTDRGSVLDNYINYLIETFQSSFSIHYFHAILFQLEQLNQFKIEQISKCLQENNSLIQKLFSHMTLSEGSLDDGIIHLSSTPAQPIYINYKPIHMVQPRTKVFIDNRDRHQYPNEGLINNFIADLIHTKTMKIIDESNTKPMDIPSKCLYFAESCEAKTILSLKLRVLIVAGDQRRYGIIGEEPGKNNRYRCLIFFTDDHTRLSAAYHCASDVHLCLDQSSTLDDIEVERSFLQSYFKSYPERMMLRAKEGSLIKVRHATKNISVPATVLQIDCSMMLIELSQSKEQCWIYRGSTLIDQMNNFYSSQDRAAKKDFTRHSARQHLSAKKSNAPEIICLNDQTKSKINRDNELNIDQTRDNKRVRLSAEQEMSNTFSTIRLTEQSTTLLSCPQSRPNGSSRLIINPIFLELTEHLLIHYNRDYHPHQCSYRCVMNAEKYFHQLPRTMNPFLKPFACQWTILENLRIRKANDVRVKQNRPIIIYCSPCGMKLCSESQVDYYLYQTNSKLSIEHFVFDSFVNLKQFYAADGRLISSDISNGQENVPISAVNAVNDEEPSSFTYRVERTPVAGVKLITYEPTMTCCTCTDGCRNRVKCACWLRTLKYAELFGDERVKSMRAKNKSEAEILYQLGYGYRRLHKNVPGGIYECNSRCSCRVETCSNRVVQNGIIAQLQLFKTVGRGWGVRTLHDLPVGTFISVYSGEIFTSEQADERGKLIGDEYQADLDFFENINNDSDDENVNSSELEEPEEEEEEEENRIPNQSSTDSVQQRLRSSTVQLRSRESQTKKERKKSSKSDQRGKSSHNSVLNRTLLPDYDGVVYTLDAKLIGNIGRYFNHSCSPNITVQNVFVDTHDIHFPWIGFFTTKIVRAGTELCWDYNYTVGEIAGRRMDCNCGSSECRRRML